MSTRLEDHSADVARAMEDAIDAALTACGMKVEEYAKRELNGEFGAPKRIDTGRLHNSIASSDVQKNGDERSVVIGTNVEYAIYVHEGTSRMDPNRFLRGAVEKHQDEYRNILKEAQK